MAAPTALMKGGGERSSQSVCGCQLPLGRGACAIHKKATIFHIVVV